MNIANILVMSEQIADDGERVLCRKAAGGAGKLTAGLDVPFTARALGQLASDRRRHLLLVAQETGRPQPHVRVGVIEHLQGDLIAQSAAQVERPERFEGELSGMS